MTPIKSRKFWITLVSVVLVLFAQAFGLDVTEDQIAGMVTIVAGYLVGQGIADHGKAKALAG